MKKLVLFLCVLSALTTVAQGGPSIAISGAAPLRLIDVKVYTTIVGGYAKTTYDLQFFNHTDRELEGEFLFPLGQGQTVTELAMELRGKLRKAVVVESTKARVAYETTVRGNIDPALLEKTAGNNYKARVYPIFPKEKKRIIISYEEVLPPSAAKLRYVLPFQFPNPIPKMRYELEIAGNSALHIVESPIGRLKQRQQKGSTKVVREISNAKLNTPLVLDIEYTDSTAQLYVQNDTFLWLPPAALAIPQKPAPKSLSIFWDVSYSMEQRNLAKELALLDRYFKRIKNLEVNLICAANELRYSRVFSVKKGDWTALRKALVARVYDGGTRIKIHPTHLMDTEELLVFTDGLVNVGSLQLPKTTGLYLINASVQADHEVMEAQALVKGGSYINLNRMTLEAAEKALWNAPVSLAVSGVDTATVFPPAGALVDIKQPVVGKLRKGRQPSFELRVAGKTLYTKEIESQSYVSASFVTKRWAYRKLQAMEQQRVKREQLAAFAKEQQLVSAYTSLIVLDRIEDYVRYEIVPPSELRSAYKRLLAERLKRATISELEDANQIQNELAKVKLWYEFPFSSEKAKTTSLQDNNVEEPTVVPQTAVLSTMTKVSEQEEQQTATETNHATPQQIGGFRIDDIQPENRIKVTGVISDESGPLPGASIVLKNTTYGTETDFDGNYSIEIPKGGVLVYSFVGMNTEEHRVTNSVPLNVVLAAANNLDEVVVVAYGVSLKNTVMNASLAGVVSGVQTAVKETTSGVITENSITESSPLLVLDLKVRSIQQLQKLSKDAIEEVLVLKPKEAMKIYGVKGRNGAIVVFTTTGVENKEQEISAFKEKLKKQIQLKGWNAQEVYLKELKAIADNDACYTAYLKVRSRYENIPMFFVDVAQLFKQRGAEQYALRILTNLLDMDLNNYELLKLVGYLSEAWGATQLAVDAYKKVLELRPEDPQSYRDLALAYQGIGAYQKSFDMLCDFYRGKHLKLDRGGRFEGIIEAAFLELNHLVATKRNKLQIPEDLREVFKPMPMDVRIVIDWNHNDTDLDLWVENPRREKLNYQNKTSEVGERMSYDFLEGFGPETYKVKNAPSGTYTIEVDYYDDIKNRISGPTFVKVTVYTKYGSPEETKEINVIRLSGKEETVQVGKVVLRQ